MARGNEIIVSADPQGNFQEFYTKSNQTVYPGMILIRDASVALINGRHTAKIYDAAADGDLPAGSFWLVTNQLHAMLGKSLTDAIPAGEKVQCYRPMAGEEVNLLLADVAGTADLHTKGEVLKVQTNTGKFIATSGTPATKVALLLETVGPLTADTLAWCEWAA